jgi:hypothetical protein
VGKSAGFYCPHAVRVERKLMPLPVDDDDILFIAPVNGTPILVDHRILAKLNLWRLVGIYVVEIWPALQWIREF